MRREADTFPAPGRFDLAGDVVPAVAAMTKTTDDGLGPEVMDRVWLKAAARDLDAFARVCREARAAGANTLAVHPTRGSDIPDNIGELLGIAADAGLLVVFVADDETIH